MGGEFGQWREWNHDASLDWHLLDEEAHAGIARWVTHLNGLHRTRPALHERDGDGSSGFSWIDGDDAAQSVLVFARHAFDEQTTSSCWRTSRLYRVRPTGWASPLRSVELIANSDDPKFGGSGFPVPDTLDAEEQAWHNRPWSAPAALPPLALVCTCGRAESAAALVGRPAHETKIGPRREVAVMGNDADRQSDAARLLTDDAPGEAAVAVAVGFALRPQLEQRRGAELAVGLDRTRDELYRDVVGIEGAKPNAHRDIDRRAQAEITLRPVHRGDRQLIPSGDDTLTPRRQLAGAGIAVARRATARRRRRLVVGLDVSRPSRRPTWGPSSARDCLTRRSQPCGRAVAFAVIEERNDLALEQIEQPVGFAGVTGRRRPPCRRWGWPSRGRDDRARPTSRRAPTHSAPR